jgi:hypothetical protein
MIIILDKLKETPSQKYMRLKYETEQLLKELKEHPPQTEQSKQNESLLQATKELYSKLSSNNVLPSSTGPSSVLHLQSLMNLLKQSKESALNDDQESFHVN